MVDTRCVQFVRRKNWSHDQTKAGNLNFRHLEGKAEILFSEVNEKGKKHMNDTNLREICYTCLEQFLSLISNMKLFCIELSL